MEALTRRHLKELSRSLPSPTAILDIAGIITAPQKNHPPSEPIMYAGLETHVRRLLRDETLLVTKYGGSTLNDELKLIAEIEDTIPPLQE